MNDRDDAGGRGESPRRSDLALVRQALRQDWPIPPEVKERILDRLIAYVAPPEPAVDADGEPPPTPAAEQPARTVIAAARVLAAFGGLSLKQALLDLQARKIDGTGGKSALDIVAEAERLALEAEAKRDRSRGPPD